MITRKQYPNHHVYEMEIGGRTFTVETGKVENWPMPSASAATATPWCW